MDQAMGNVTAALKDKAMLDNTLLLFSADNGGVTHGGQVELHCELRWCAYC